MLGATRGMGRSLARKLAARGERIFLLGRTAESLRCSAADLEARGAPAPVGSAHCDLLEPDGFEAALEAADRALGGFDTAVLSAGLYGTQDELEVDATRRRELLIANFAYSVEWCEAVRRRLMSRDGGTLCVYSSVAGLRGRKPVVFYGAAKAGLTCYLEGLDHRYALQGLRVVSVLPGFVHTEMTDGLAPPPFSGQPDAVADVVLRSIDRAKPLTYAPGIWRAILLVVRALPRAVMRRVAF